MLSCVCSVIDHIWRQIVIKNKIEFIYWIETRLSIKNSVKQQRKNTVQQTSNANVCATIMLRNNQYINYRVNCMLGDLLIG